MTQTEFRKLISQAKNIEWFNTIEIKISFKNINLELDFKGLTTLHKFINQQINGWEKLGESLPNELMSSKNYFINIEQQIVNFINSYSNQEVGSSLDSYFRTIKNKIENTDNTIFTYDCPETEFLKEVYINYPLNFIGAFTYLTGNLNQNINVKENFIGYLLAYEFTSKDHSNIVERKEKEKSSLNKLKNDFKKSLPELEAQLMDHLKNSKEKYEEIGRELDEFKENKENSYADWFSKTQELFELFNNSSNSKIQELEKTYEAKLKLSEPAKYWSDRGKELKKQGWIAFSIMSVLVLIAVFTLGELLWKTPEQIYNSFFGGDKSAAIRWSIVYVTFISFMVFLIKAITKVMFSSFHLARDSEERHTLTYFYLSLLKDSNVDDKDRQLIMQSLFSRAETGLLKDDAAPTMPNDMVGKLFGK